MGSGKFDGWELVVVLRGDVVPRVEAGVVRAESIFSPASAAVLGQPRRLVPLFGVSRERLRHEATSLSMAPDATPDLSRYYRVEGDSEGFEEAQKQLIGDETVEAAYLKPPCELPAINDMVPRIEDTPPTTPDYAARQLYLDAAPGGVDARFAWTLPGGGGAGVSVIDVEGAWRFGHEDLLQNQGGVIAGTQSTDLGWRNHGTAVVGVFGGDRNGQGVTGIAPDANTRAISIFGPGMGSAAAIRQAANALGAGDIILLELHRPGPRFAFQARGDQRGYIAIEWWPDDFDAIRFAIGRGVIVIEAGGNGAENLDDPVYSNPAAGFPATWTNPFNRNNRDSGAIIVGAGAPPPNTHGRNHGADRSRLAFSNFGACVDVQGWGREVTTCGYGDLQGGANEDFWYTDQFSGTSSASPVVVGSVACLQGILLARGTPVLTPARARACLRGTGSPQQDEPGRPATERVGTRPDLRAMVAWATPKTTKEIKEAKELKERDKSVLKDLKDRIKDRKEKDQKEFKEHKEFKEKERKELKEHKEIKEFKELKEFKEKDKDIREAGPAAAEPDVAGRLDQLEQAVSELAHFIGGELRPDLGGSALTREDDVDAQITAAKQAKDAKDTEKPRER